jgi:hypothetical protein
MLVPLQNHYVLHWFSSQRESLQFEFSKFGPRFKTFVFYNVLAPREGLQLEFSKCGRPFNQVAAEIEQL